MMTWPELMPTRMLIVSSRPSLKVARVSIIARPVRTAQRADSAIVLPQFSTNVSASWV
jgi:hypothetical protein